MCTSRIFSGSWTRCPEEHTRTTGVGRLESDIPIDISSDSTSLEITDEHLSIARWESDEVIGYLECLSWGEITSSKSYIIIARSDGFDTPFVVRISDFDSIFQCLF